MLEDTNSLDGAQFMYIIIQVLVTFVSSKDKDFKVVRPGKKQH